MPVDSTKRLEMLGAALDLLDEGVAVLDSDSIIVYWNDAAAALTGHRRINLLSRPCPANLYETREDTQECGFHENSLHSDERYKGPVYSGQMYIQKSLADIPSPAVDSNKPMLVEMRHHLGHTLPAMLRKAVLRDSLGERMGTALLFRPAEPVDELPHGESGEATGIGRTQEEIEERLEEAFHDWKTNGVPFGLLWIVVDQAAQMRRTHGREACEAMLRIVEHRLAHGLKPTEVIGRWGNDEFLVLSHERTSEMLLQHGSHLTGLTRTADFRWWGDRVSLTASIGASQAVEGDTLARLMLEAQQSMHASTYAGGNRVTHGRAQTCSR